MIVPWPTSTQGEDMSKPSLADTIHENHELAVEGHKRLREDIDRMNLHVASLLTSRTDLLARMSKVENTPPEADRIRFSGPIVVFIVTTAFAIMAPFWVVRSDIRDIVTRMTMQAELDKANIISLRESLEAMKRRQELQQFELAGYGKSIQELKEQVGTKGGRK